MNKEDKKILGLMHKILALAVTKKNIVVRLQTGCNAFMVQHFDPKDNYNNVWDIDTEFDGHIYGKENTIKLLENIISELKETEDLKHE